MRPSDNFPTDLQAERQHWMAILAKATPEQLMHQVSQLIQELGELPEYGILRGPETGLVMVQGRAGGTGQPFNLGEMPLSRCVVQVQPGWATPLATGDSSPQPEPLVHGFGYVAGRSLEQARWAAILDALMQLPNWHDRVQSSVIHPLEAIAQAKQTQQQQQTQATQVNFFTLQRGQG